MRFKEVQFPRKNSPRETELRIFSELKLNLGDFLQENPFKSLLVSPEYLEGLSFSAMLGKAQKLKVANSRLSI